MNAVIAFRVDGNSTIGYGHLMRTQALARQMEKYGAEVIFLSRNPENIQNYPVRFLNSESNRIAEDQMVEQILCEMQADLLIVDSYEYDQERLHRMAGLDLFTVYLDDMNQYEFYMDFVVNGNAYAPCLNYRGTACKLLGLEYLLLRDEFCCLPARHICTKVKDVLITFGAADTENSTPVILRQLAGYQFFNELDWHVVIGPAFQNAGEIEKLVGSWTNVHIYHNPNIKNLMNKCDICISAAGSTSYELAACGVPALLLVISDNQILLAEEMHKQGMAINLGWYSKLEKQPLFAALHALISNYDLRRKMAAIGQKSIDGHGAERLAEVLLEAIRRGKFAGNS